MDAGESFPPRTLDTKRGTVERVFAGLLLLEKDETEAEAAAIPIVSTVGFYCAGRGLVYAYRDISTSSSSSGDGTGP